LILDARQRKSPYWKLFYSAPSSQNEEYGIFISYICIFLGEVSLSVFARTSDLRFVRRTCDVLSQMYSCIDENYGIDLMNNFNSHFSSFERFEGDGERSQRTQRSR
jgi:hypothetical protein